ncbi:MFS general substrate transporter [Clavulina sp. PMI_390]|nr:MFS general substrate transporter [Clavulina sp. PMI_390]
MSSPSNTTSESLHGNSSEYSGLESRPLLAGRPRDVTIAERDRPLKPLARKPTPLPLAALLILAFVRVAEPINFTQLFPYVNQMVEDLGIAAPENVGYYSGLADSCFSFAQLLTIYFWSSLSDRIGRKPVVMIGVSGAALSAACFGFSSSLPAMLISRSIAGALSGNAAVVNSMVSEMTDETNQGAAFPLLGATWYIGCIIGPVVGGSLSNPSRKWPEMVKKFPIFQTYPYLLPCLVSSSFSVVAVITCGLFVQEVCPRPCASEAPSRKGQKEGLLYLLSKREIRAVLIAAFLFNLLGVGFDVVFTLYSYTRVELGGMARTPTQIGWILAISGMVGTTSALFIFPRIQRRFNNRQLYTFFSGFWPITFALMPVGNLAARWVKQVESKGKPAMEVWLWGAFIMILAPKMIAVNLYPLTMIIVKSSVDNPAHLGSMFGLQQTTSAIARGIAPYFVSSLFAFSVDRKAFGGTLIWVVMVVLSLCGVLLSTRVVNVPAPRILLRAGREDDERGHRDVS